MEDIPRRAGTSGWHGTESGGPLVTLNLCVMRRYYAKMSVDGVDGLVLSGLDVIYWF